MPNSLIISPSVEVSMTNLDVNGVTLIPLVHCGGLVLLLEVIMLILVVLVLIVLRTLIFTIIFVENAFDVFLDISHLGVLD